MKKIMILLFLCSISLFGQDSLKTPSRWTIVVEGAIQEHDKRLFTYSQRQTLLDKHAGFFGTYQLGFRVDKKVLEKRLLEVSLGIGISTELSTFTRPFDYKYGSSGFGFEILLVTDRYYKNVLQLPLAIHLPINEKIKLGAEVLPQFNFLTIATRPGLNNGDFFPFTWWSFNFHSLEVNPSLVWVGEKYIFGLKYRLAQVKKIDPIIFNSMIRDPRTEQTFEGENPFKLWFSMGYRL